MTAPIIEMAAMDASRAINHSNTLAIRNTEPAGLIGFIKQPNRPLQVHHGYPRRVA